jgi:hypothetical protein
MALMDLVTAHRLAHTIEHIHARERARLINSRPGKSERVTAAQEFDEMAATCLGDLIYNVANRKR